MVMLSKIVASIVRRRIIQHSVVEEKGAEQVADLIGDIVYYTLVIFSIFV
jgi:hypothetical protein